MTADPSGAASTPGARARWQPWLRLAAAATVLLAVSQALWLWQTWPVRELLPPAGLAGADAR